MLWLMRTMDMGRWENWLCLCYAHWAFLGHSRWQKPESDPRNPIRYGGNNYGGSTPIIPWKWYFWYTKGILNGRIRSQKWVQSKALDLISLVQPFLTILNTPGKSIGDCSNYATDIWPFHGHISGTRSIEMILTSFPMVLHVIKYI